jgi:hypothetical protein
MLHTMGRWPRGVGGKPDGDREMKMKITKSQLVKIIKEEIEEEGN